MFQHMNGPTAREGFFERLKLIISPAEFQSLMRRLARQYKRRSDRELRIASWDYCGARQRARYARQIARRELKAANVTPVTA